MWLFDSGLHYLDLLCRHYGLQMACAQVNSVEVKYLKSLFQLCGNSNFNSLYTLSCTLVDKRTRVYAWMGDFIPGWVSVVRFAVYIYEAISFLWKVCTLYVVYKCLFNTYRYVTDACVGVTIAVLLFAFPSERPNILCFRNPNSK